MEKASKGFSVSNLRTFYGSGITDIGYNKTECKKDKLLDFLYNSIPGIKAVITIDSEGNIISSRYYKNNSIKRHSWMNYFAKKLLALIEISQLSKKADDNLEIINTQNELVAVKSVNEKCYLVIILKREIQDYLSPTSQNSLVN